MTPPTIHLNGTSGRELFAGYEAAHAAVKQAQEIFGKIEFNPRDYYVQNEHAWTKARQGRLEQWKALAQVEEYL
jgi:hypothetical protein